MLGYSRYYYRRCMGCRYPRRGRCRFAQLAQHPPTRRATASCAPRRQTAATTYLHDDAMLDGERFNFYVFTDYLLPPIIFEAGYNMEVRPFFNNLGPTCFFAFATCWDRTTSSCGESSRRS